jgi:hypothetical protein
MGCPWLTQRPVIDLAPRGYCHGLPQALPETSSGASPVTQPVTLRGMDVNYGSCDENL